MMERQNDNIKVGIDLMQTKLIRVVVGVVSLWLVAQGAVGNEARARRGMAATVHPLATEAAVAAMKEGGNAIDGAVAAGLILGVVDGHNSGIGGGCFILLRRSNGEIVALDGREMAPAAATRDMYLKAGRANTSLSQTGPLAVGVPGALAAYAHACTNFGRLPFKSHLLRAAEMSAQGFPIDSHYAGCLAGTVAELKQFEAARAIFLHPDGTPLKRGEILRQPDLAQTYRAIAERGVGWFYGGPFAESAGAWMKSNGGLLTVADFKNYTVQRREPIRTRYRSWEVVGFPPPSSGGVHVAQILNMLEKFDLPAMRSDSPDFVHLTAEAMKLAFADRAFWLGDPDFTRVPLDLVSKDYAAALAKRIDPRRATDVTSHGTPTNVQAVFGGHTTHFSVADSEGNWVAVTATLNTSFGSKVVVPGTGVVLNNQMDDFSIQPGVTNYFGLIGAEANAVAPGKRPLSSMSPTIVLREGEPVLALGAAGGPTIINQTVLAIVRVFDFGMSIKDALIEPRFHHQWRPDELKVERRLAEGVLSELKKRGHKIVVSGAIGATQAVGTERGREQLIGVSDPRVEGMAKGF